MYFKKAKINSEKLYIPLSSIYDKQSIINQQLAGFFYKFPLTQSHWFSLIKKKKKAYLAGRSFYNEKRVSQLALRGLCPIYVKLGPKRHSFYYY